MRAACLEEFYFEVQINYIFLYERWSLINFHTFFEGLRSWKEKMTTTPSFFWAQNKVRTNFIMRKTIGIFVAQ